MPEIEKMVLTLSKPAVEVIMHALQNCPGLTWAQSNVAIMELHQQIAQAQQPAPAAPAAPALATTTKKK